MVSVSSAANAARSAAVAKVTSVSTPNVASFCLAFVALADQLADLLDQPRAEGEQPAGRPFVDVSIGIRGDRTEGQR